MKEWTLITLFGYFYLSSMLLDKLLVYLNNLL